MRPTDPRELLHPVLTPETYQRLGIAPPRPPQLYGTGGPVSSAGTPLRVSHPSTRVRQGIHVVLIAPFQHAASSSDP